MKKTNIQRLIELLNDGLWHSAQELSSHISWRFGATVHAARNRGYKIEKRQVSQYKYEYRLFSEQILQR